MSEPCAHERDVTHVPASQLDDLKAIVRRQTAELFDLRDEVARLRLDAVYCDVVDLRAAVDRMERLARDLDAKADGITAVSYGDRWRRQQLRTIADLIRVARRGTL